MADGRKSCEKPYAPADQAAVNSARAMRVAEIINDFRSIQYHIAALQRTPRAEEFYLEGYVWMRHCVAEAQAVLAQDYSHAGQEPEGDAEQEKVLLQLYVSCRLPGRG
jgi:hypothetical protein